MMSGEQAPSGGDRVTGGEALGQWPLPLALALSHSLCLAVGEADDGNFQDQKARLDLFHTTDMQLRNWGSNSTLGRLFESDSRLGLRLVTSQEWGKSKQPPLRHIPPNAGSN